MNNALRYGYITNGLGDHRLDDALQMLADHGYSGVGITLDHHHLDPFASDVAMQTAKIADRLRDLDLSVVIETGGRFVLDPRRKHEPTLLSDEGRDRRVQLLEIAIRIAADLGAEAMSFWSGRKAPNDSDETAWQRLVDGCTHLASVADHHNVQLAFEPEPGMFVQYIEEWRRLAVEVASERLGVTLDLGHCHAIEDLSTAECIREVGAALRNVQIEDMERGVHEHLDFGEGSMDFPPILAALRDADYRGLVNVELSRHSPVAHIVVPRAIEFLRNAEMQGVGA